MSLATPIKIRMLQRKLYQKAKEEPNYRFYLLYDKMWREDILLHAYELAKANKGVPGVDGQSFADIESEGREKSLQGIREDLREKTYEPQAVSIDGQVSPEPHRSPNQHSGVGGVRLQWMNSSLDRASVIPARPTLLDAVEFEVLAIKVQNENLRRAVASGFKTIFVTRSRCSKLPR